MNTYLGIDVGGTKLLIGEVNEQGEILQSKRYPTGFHSQEEIINALLPYLDDYIETMGFIGTPQAVGMGVVGVVDNRRGEWISFDHRVTGPPILLEKIISDKMHLPVAIDNDVRSATTAELLLGHGRSTKNFIYMNVGTGFAAGFVCDGVIIRGANNNSGEIGHMVVDYNSDVLCICGRYGCQENLVSGMGFSRRARELLPQYPNTKLPIPSDGTNIDARDLYRLADEGDELCVEITQTSAKVLACAIMNCVRVTDPDTIILGGGAVCDGWLLEKMKAYLNDATLRGITNGILLSELSPKDIGLIGASSLAMVKAGLLK